MPDIKTTRVFIIKKGQYFTFINKHFNKQFKINKNRTGKINIKFKNKLPFKLFRTIIIETLFGQVNFYVIKTDTLFFLIKNINRFGIYFNNVIN